MIVEIPQAETCCGQSLRFGVVLVIVFRLILFILAVLFGANILPLGNEKFYPGPKDSFPEECHKLYNQTTQEIVLVTVTVVLVFLWLLLMTPAVVWEIPPMILTGALLEILIFFWLFFIFAYQFSLSIVRQYMNFLLIYSLIWLAVEVFVLWIIWSYYVDVKDSLERERRNSSLRSYDEDQTSQWGEEV